MPALIRNSRPTSPPLQERGSLGTAAIIRQSQRKRNRPAWYWATLLTVPDRELENATVLEDAQVAMLRAPCGRTAESNLT